MSHVRVAPLADRSKLGAVCIDMGSVVVDERPTWSYWQIAGAPASAARAG